MQLIDIPPANALEEVFVKGREGIMTVEQVIDFLMSSKLYFPSIQQCRNDCLDLIPLTFNRDEELMACARKNGLL